MQSLEMGKCHQHTNFTQRLRTNLEFMQDLQNNNGGLPNRLDDTLKKIDYQDSQKFLKKVHQYQV